MRCAPGWAARELAVVRELIELDARRCITPSTVETIAEAFQTLSVLAHILEDHIGDVPSTMPWEERLSRLESYLSARSRQERHT